jgi:hypothetical protein
MTGSTEEAQTRLTEILEELAEDVGFSEHPYKRAKRATGPLNYGEVLHCKQARKNWATLSCQYRCTAKCEFRVKYQFKSLLLHIWTIGEHTHGSEIRKRGLKLDRAAKLLDVVGGSSSGMQEHFHVYVAAADPHC